MRLLHFLKSSAVLLCASCTATVVGTGTPPESPPAEDAPVDPSQEQGPSTPPSTSNSASPPPASNKPSSPSKPSPLQVTGQWKGAITEINETLFLDITQSSDFVGGQLCEAPNRDCHFISNGNFNGTDLSVKVSWSESPGGKIETMQLDLKITSDGKALRGPITGSKCTSCNYTAYLQKQ